MSSSTLRGGWQLRNVADFIFPNQELTSGCWHRLYQLRWQPTQFNRSDKEHMKSKAKEILDTTKQCWPRQNPSKSSESESSCYIFGQEEEDIARKSMAIYTHVRSLQEVFTRLEKCRKPVSMDGQMNIGMVICHNDNVIRMQMRSSHLFFFFFFCGFVFQ